MTDVVKQAGNLLGWVGKNVGSIAQYATGSTQVSEAGRSAVREVVGTVSRRGHIFVRLGGLSGAAAVILGAYGAHKFKTDDKEKDISLITAYDTAVRYHFLHSVALLAVPLTNRPYLVGSLMLLGIAGFSGSIYLHCFSENSKYRKVTPYGGMVLILAWLSAAL